MINPYGLQMLLVPFQTISIGALRAYIQEWNSPNFQGHETWPFIALLLGIVIGVALSLAVLVWRSSHPHMAVVGRVPGTEHFRNVDRHQVETLPGLVALRIDESLYFANAQALESRIEALLRTHPGTRCILLILSAVNQLDSTALGILTELEKSLASRNISLQFSEVKGPVLDRLRPTPLGERMKDRIYLSTHQAFLAHTDNTVSA